MKKDKNVKKPALFDVEIKDTDEIKASEFIGRFKDDFIDNNEIYLKNYIDADIGVAFSHIKKCYKRYVCEAGWDENKFEGIIYIIAKNRKMLIPSVFLNYGMKYDDGKLTKEIAGEKRKYNLNKEKYKLKAKGKSEISQEEQELLDYIAQHGGR